MPTTRAEWQALIADARAALDRPMNHFERRRALHALHELEMAAALACAYMPRVPYMPPTR